MDKSSGVGVLDKAATVLSALEAGPSTVALRDHTGESAQLYRRQGDQRICVAAAERPMGLRDSIPVGSALTMRAGSAAQVLLAWEEPDRLHRGLQGARFTATTLSAVRRRGWAQSIGEREPGVASVSAPVRAPSGRVVAAVSISGPVERFTRQPGRVHPSGVETARTGGTWPLNIGQVYTTLTRLQRDGLVDELGTRPDGSVVYALTDAGKAEV